MFKPKSLLVAALVLMAANLMWANSNVALNKPVTAVGAGFFSGPTNIVCPGTPAAPSTVTDGIFAPETTCWLNGVAWTGNDNSLDINLNGTFNIDAAIVQADDNDVYQLQYRGTDNLYQDWWLVGTIPSFGLVTRPNADQVTQQSLPTVTATGLRIFAPVGSGDNLYAVSEVQVFGTPTPEPGSMILLACALPGLGLLKRRLRK